MKRYYEGHERVYQQLVADGADCWGKDDFENVFMLGFLQHALAKTKIDAKPLVRSLVVGCGSGCIL